MVHLPARGTIRFRLTATYAAVGILITALCLGATRAVASREDRSRIARREAVTLAEEIGTKIDSAYEGVLAFDLTGNFRRKDRTLAEIAQLTTKVRLLRANRLGAGAATQLDEVERAINEGRARTGQVFDDHASRGGPARPEALEQLEQAMDNLSDRGDRLLAVINRFAQNEASAAARLIGTSIIVIGLFGIGFAVLLGLALGRGIAEPLLRLRDAATALRAGDFNVAVDVAGAVEIGQLAQAFTAMAKDLRDKRQLESELRQAHKLEAIGRLASGIAHEINTPVQFLSDSTRFVDEATRDLLALVDKYRAVSDPAIAATADLRREVAEMEEAMDFPFVVAKLPVALVAMTDGLNRIAGIVSSMKQFAHPDQSGPTAADLNAAVTSTLTIARNEYKYVAELHTDLGELPLVVCHPGELNQVLLNLVVNAAHAIGDVVKGTSAKGRIVVRTRREGDDALISIADTGGGIPESIREHIFDPFFTTKEVGKGTGQGLAIARTVVVEKHGGTLTFDSEVGQGTTFTIRLPLAGKTMKAAA